jgi:hypothetical protein
MVFYRKKKKKKKKKKNSGSQGGPGVNEVSFRARPPHNVHSTERKNSGSRRGPDVNEVSFRARLHHNMHSPLGVEVFYNLCIVSYIGVVSFFVVCGI